MTHEMREADGLAEVLETDLDWQDLEISGRSRAALDEVATWLDRPSPGSWALFQGPAGTGKTLAASLLGRDAGVQVYRIDLAAIIAKYIGETEKYLDPFLDQAATLGAILYAEGAERTFPQRTESRHPTDRSENQAIGYLLQRLESYRGLVVFAVESPYQLDEEFLSRCRVVVPF